MYKYYIKENGYILGTAKGKRLAVKYLKEYFVISKIKDEVWENIAGNISVHTGKSKYTIERN